MIKYQEIKVIIFDFIGVLLFKKTNYKPNNLIDKIDSDIGQVICDDIFKKETIKKYKINEKKFQDILEQIVNKYKPFLPLWKLLPKLHKKYKLAVINNGTSLTLPLFKSKYLTNNNFDIFISSAIEGIKKPNRKIYLLTANKLKVKPEQCLFMDDSMENIQGAKNIGMKTIWWNNKENGFKKFIKFLKK